MGIITLTDRISVRVSAKNDMQSNDYKKATGGAIASKLGNGNVSDSLKSQLGNTKNPTITDENGDTWVSMEDMIDAGKAMNGDGAFDEKTTYKYGNVACVPVGSLYAVSGMRGNVGLYNLYGPVYTDSGNVHAYYGNVGDPDPTDRSVLVAIVHNINDDSYHIVFNSDQRPWANYWGYRNEYPTSETVKDFVSGGGGPGTGTTIYPKDASSIYKIPITDVGQTLLSLSAYGEETEETTGGSLIDWTKSDAEIEEDIRDQEEVWDVIQNAVSSSSSTAKIPVGPYVNVGHIDDSWDSTSGGGHTGGDF